MSRMSRNKRSAFERWCVNEIKDHLGYENVRRNLSQYQDKGGADILIPHWSIECKRYARGRDATVLVSLPTWFYIVREAIPF